MAGYGACAQRVCRLFCAAEQHSAAAVDQARHLHLRGSAVLAAAHTCGSVHLCCALAVPQGAKDAAEQEAQLSQWSRLHWVRTGLSLTSLAVMLATVLGGERSRS